MTNTDPAPDLVPSRTRKALREALPALVGPAQADLAAGVAIADRLRAVADDIEHVAFQEARRESDGGRAMTWAQVGVALEMDPSAARARFDRLRLRIADR